MTPSTLLIHTMVVVYDETSSNSAHAEMQTRYDMGSLLSRFLFHFLPLSQH